MASHDRPEAAFELVDDADLGLKIPKLKKPFEAFTPAEKDALALELEKLSGLIPDRIRALEARYLALYREAEAAGEADDAAFFEALERAGAVARKIAELNTLYYAIQGEFLTTYVG